MHICMLCPNPVIYDGRALRHARALAAAGHRLTMLGVIGPNDTDRPPTLDVSIRRLRRQRRGVVPRALWAATALRQHAARSLYARLPSSLRHPGVAALAVACSAVELCAMALAHPADLIYANDLTTLPAAAWAARLLRVPFLYDAREWYVDESPDLTEVERDARRLTEARYIQGAAAVLTVNDLIADEYQRSYGVPRPLVVRNLPPLCPLTRPIACGPPGTLRLLYQSLNVGLVQDGTDDLLRAIARVRDRLDVRLTLRGGIKPHEEARLQRRLQELHIADRVRLAPLVPDADALVAEAIAEGAELGLALHGPHALSYTYTTSGKVFEYQIAGVAVCATDLVGNRASVDERAGIFYPYGDDRRLGEIFLMLGQDKERLLAMRRSARQRAEQELCWEREGPQLLALCAGLRSSPAP